MRRDTDRQTSPGPPPRSVSAALVAALLATAGATLPAGAQTILNVERLQPRDVEGWRWGIEGALSVSEGNTDHVDLLTGLVLGHRWPGDWLRMFAGLDYRSEPDEALENDRYLHVRYNHWLAERWQSFHFVQVQKSHSNLLQRRLLFGSGLRRRLLGGTTTLDVGTGAMYEMEDLDPDRPIGSHPVESRVWRMANLVVVTRPLSESIRLVALSYVQPDLSAFDDLRTLVDVTFLISVTEHVDLTIRNEWRHDSRPPQGRVRNDYVLRTGLTLSFR